MSTTTVLKIAAHTASPTNSGLAIHRPQAQAPARATITLPPDILAELDAICVQLFGYADPRNRKSVVRMIVRAAGPLWEQTPMKHVLVPPSMVEIEAARAK